MNLSSYALEILYPQEEVAKAELKVVQLFLLMFYCCLRKVFDTFHFELVIRLFKTLKFFYPPKGASKAELKVVQLFLLIFYFLVEKRILDIQFNNGFSPF